MFAKCFSSVDCWLGCNLCLYVNVGGSGESVGCSETLMFPTVGGVGGVGVSIRVLGAYVLKAYGLIGALF